MYKMLDACPTCGSDLVVTEVRCTHCDTMVRGRWEPCRFCRLDAETLSFIEAFVQNRGNLREMEREMSESYWTLRARLNQVIDAMGLEQERVEVPDAAAELRREILQKVQSGALEAAEAARRLARLTTQGEGEES